MDRINGEIEIYIYIYHIISLILGEQVNKEAKIRAQKILVNLKITRKRSAVIQL